jgi:PEP-CTERM motif
MENQTPQVWGVTVNVRRNSFDLRANDRSGFATFYTGIGIMKPGEKLFQRTCGVDNVTKTFLRASFGSIALAGMVVAGSAQALTLNTAGVKANALLTLNSNAASTLASNGISMRALGNATSAGTNVFNLPITSADISVGLFKLTPQGGDAVGSALQLVKGSRSAVMANFDVVYGSGTGAGTIAGDVIINGKTQKMQLFTFKEQTPLSVKLSGLSLTLNQNLNNLKLTSTAASTFASALNLSSSAANTLAALDYGTLKMDITSTKRTPVSTKAFTAANLVPEPSTYALMGLGLAGVALVARRKQQAEKAAA